MNKKILHFSKLVELNGQVEKVIQTLFFYIAFEITISLKASGTFKKVLRNQVGMLMLTNFAHGRHGISQHVHIVAPIPFF